MQFIDNDKVIKEIKENGQLQRYLEYSLGLKSAGRNSRRYRCPFCNRGEHKRHSFVLNPAGTLSKQTYDSAKCWACGTYVSNTLECIMKYEGCDFIKAVNIANELLGNKHYQEKKLEAFEDIDSDAKRQEKIKQVIGCRNEVNNKVNSNKALCEKAKAYFKKRGILSVVNRVNKNDTVPLRIASSSYNGTTYIYYDFKKPKHKKYEGLIIKKDVDKKRHPYNVCLEGSDIAFLKPFKHNKLTIVEGIETALTVLYYGGNVCCLNSASNTGKLLDVLSEEPEKYKGIIFNIQTDADDAGDRACEELRAKFEELGLTYQVDPIRAKLKQLQANGYKGVTDFNDWHQIQIEWRKRNEESKRQQQKN